MPDHVLKEEPFQFGEGGRLFGVLTVPVMPPRNAQDLPVFVFLSAGVLHRVGPYRLYVRLARGLAQMGFSSLRVDLAGIGDSPRRSGFTNQQSVAADFAEILGVLELRLGRVPLVLAGLCSGADNAIRLAIAEARVVGMVLLDPICFPDHGLSGFRSRVIIEKYTDPTRYIGWLKRRFKALTRPPREKRAAERSVDRLAIRDLPTQEQLRASLEIIGKRGGRVLSVFTDYAHGYYNQSGQLGRVLRVKRYEQFCTELFWPRAHHTYWLELHRRRLIGEIKNWASKHIHR